jgi:hypothetical protein
MGNKSSSKKHTNDPSTVVALEESDLDMIEKHQLKNLLDVYINETNVVAYMALMNIISSSKKNGKINSSHVKLINDHLKKYTDNDNVEVIKILLSGSSKTILSSLSGLANKRNWYAIALEFSILFDETKNKKDDINKLYESGVTSSDMSSIYINYDNVRKKAINTCREASDNGLALATLIIAQATDDKNTKVKLHEKAAKQGCVISAKFMAKYHMSSGEYFFALYYLHMIRESLICWNKLLITYLEVVNQDIDKAIKFSEMSED